MVNTGTVLKAMERTLKTQVQKHNFSTMQNMGMQYELRGLACQKDTKAGGLLNSRSAWDTARLGPGVVEQDRAPPSYQLSKLLCLREAGRSLNPFVMLKENVLAVF